MDIMWICFFVLFVFCCLFLLLFFYYDLKEFCVNKPKERAPLSYTSGSFLCDWTSGGVGGIVASGSTATTTHKDHVTAHHYRNQFSSDHSGERFPSPEGDIGKYRHEYRGGTVNF